MTESSKKPLKNRRTVAKQARRTQLIKATMKCVARSGLSGTTMAEITQEAGLSLGIVNLHFQSKEKLLNETLLYLSEEYMAGWTKIHVDASLGTAEKLLALVNFDFSANVCQRNKLAVWFAFWGESKSRPTYQKICSRHDQTADQVLHETCGKLITEGGYSNTSVDQVVASYTAMTTGLWLDMLVAPKNMNRRQAREICLNYLAAIFPRHFPVQ